MSSLPKDLLDILACPQCRGPLQVEAASLRCDTCMLRYRVENGIPVMLISEAEHVQQSEDPGDGNPAGAD
jgi:uncharacterized protein